MAEPKNRERLEAEWWDDWRRADYSWSGLAKKGLGDEPVSSRQGLFGETTLQAYWRRDPETGIMRTDEQMLAVGELVTGPQGELWHLAHVPLEWREGHSGKRFWSSANHQRVIEILNARLELAVSTRISHQNSEEKFDGRAQFSGIVLASNWFFSQKANEASDTWEADIASALGVICKRAWISSIIFCEAKLDHRSDFSESFFCHLWFYKLVFVQNISFARCKFVGFANFEEVNFQGNFDLMNIFALGRLSFSNLKFCEFAYFAYALFCSSFLFKNVEFQKKAFFNKSKFEEEVSFSSVFFLKNAGSDDFQGAFEFQGAFFGGGVRFSDTNEWGKSNIPWSRAFFDAKTSGTLSFERSPLPPISAFHGLKLDNGALLSFDDPGTKATLASFSEQLSTIKDAKENASGSKEKMPPDQANRLLDDLAGGCRVLKKYSESQGDRERSQRFFRLELEARMKSDEVSRFEKWVFAGYRMFSDYAAPIGRPLLGLFVAFVGFGLFYWAIAALWFVPTAVFDRKLFVGSFDFSLRQTFPFIATDMKAENIDISMRKVLLGEGDRWQNLLLRCVTVLQTTFSLAMIFLSGLAIRRRFKMD
jgi:hypothetical protein